MQFPHKVYTENIDKLKGKETGIFTKTIPIPIRATSAHNLGKEPYLMAGPTLLSWCLNGFYCCIALEIKEYIRVTFYTFDFTT